MLSEIRDFVKKYFYEKYFYDIILFIIAALLIMLSFAAGYIFAESQSKEPIKIEQTQ